LKFEKNIPYQVNNHNNHVLLHQTKFLVKLNLGKIFTENICINNKLI